MKVLPDQPMTFSQLLFNLMFFAATGTGLAIMQHKPFYLGLAGGLIAGVLLILPVFIIVNLVHKCRGRSS